jgi:hypothetical protein
MRKAKIPTMAVEVRKTPLGDEGPIEVEVEIMDKIIPHTLVDGGSGINIMPVATLASSPLLTWSFFRLSKGYER